MNLEIKPISLQLASLANTSLSDKARQNLITLINQLFVDLELGHSCTKLSKINSEMSEANIIKLLLQSNLATKFTSIPENLEPTPITILQFKEDVLIYISKYLQYELDIACHIHKLTLRTNVETCSKYTESINFLEKLKNAEDLPNSDQLLAITNCIQNKLSFITGGPGTGKTTTVTLLLWVLYQLYGANCNIKICAPTGKASARVKDSITNSIKYFKEKKLTIFSDDFDSLLGNGNNFGTIHKLLGSNKNSIYFKHNKDNLLDIDVLVIDESSMISLPLYNKLLQAVNCKTIKHIIFLGDKNQLSSVEEGYVFASLIGEGKKLDLFTSPASTNVSNLSISKRNTDDVGVLANAILTQNMPQIEKVLENSSKISLTKPKLNNILLRSFNSNNYSINTYLNFIIKTEILDYKELFIKFNQQIILCLTNTGLLGSININQQVEKKAKLLFKTINIWYTGRPIIILENDYSLGLYNGDIGICQIKHDKVVIIFENGKEFIPEVLPKHQLAYALSIHKSQGSEYEHVNIILPEGQNNKLLCTNELIYTAITRAKKSIIIYSEKETIKQAINNRTNRNTGLSYLLT